MGVIKIKSNKWYGRFWPPERRKIFIMQAIADYKEKEIMDSTKQQFRDYYIYGKMPSDKENE